MDKQLATLDSVQFAHSKSLPDYSCNKDAATVLLKRLELYYRDQPGVEFSVVPRVYVNSHTGEKVTRYDIRSNIIFDVGSLTARVG